MFTYGQREKIAPPLAGTEVSLRLLFKKTVCELNSLNGLERSQEASQGRDTFLKELESGQELPAGRVLEVSPGCTGIASYCLP